MAECFFMKKKDALITLVKGKDVFLATHWDADGVCSAAIIYHLIKDHAKSVKTTSKGELFLITKDDFEGDPDIIICTDIHPSAELDPKKVIYIDHHPAGETENYLMAIHDEKSQSCSLLIWHELIQDLRNPYFIFLTLLGYFGDRGDREEIPIDLQILANDLLKIRTSFGEHNLMQRKESYYDNSSYYEIERYVSAINSGKRMDWSGDVPLELLKGINDFRPFIYNYHPLAQQLKEYKFLLRELYSAKLKVKDAGKIQYSLINSDKNIQGVLCAKNMKDKPLLVMNRRKGKIIASMRVPDSLDFDAGKFLEEFNQQIPSFIGGGHEKAAGLTMDYKDLDIFLELLEKNSS
jgi:single-stranded DNA-specific DHH superfamily exonuclease